MYISYMWVCMYMPHLLKSSLDMHLGYFHVLAIVNSHSYLLSSQKLSHDTSISRKVAMYHLLLPGKCHPQSRPIPCNGIRKNGYNWMNQNTVLWT